MFYTQTVGVTKGEADWQYISRTERTPSFIPPSDRMGNSYLLTSAGEPQAMQHLSLDVIIRVWCHGRHSLFITQTLRPMTGDVYQVICMDN